MSIKENLIRARGVIAEFPEEQVDLGVYREVLDCGTFYCAYGILTTDPYFSGKGIKLNAAEIPYSLDPMNELFGEDALWRFFSSKGAGNYDDVILEKTPNISDKDLALARIDIGLNEL